MTILYTLLVSLDDDAKSCTLFESLLGIPISELGVHFLSSICMTSFIPGVSRHKNYIIVVGVVIISNIFVL
jgi:hypothetical protein